VEKERRAAGITARREAATSMAIFLRGHGHARHFQSCLSHGGTGCLCVFCHYGPSCGRSHIPGIYLSDLPKPARPSNRATGQHAGAARAALKGGAGGGAGTPLRQTGVTLTTLLPLGREALCCHTAVRLESVAPPGAHCTFYSRTVSMMCP
jgi:hypothetical protein